jgi:hypothetical protein
MNGPERLARFLSAWALAAGLAGGPGCLSFCHPVDPPKADLVQPCQDAPKFCRDHVYFFFVHGLDPLDFANLSGVRDYVQALGFTKTYYGQLYHSFLFEHEIHRIHHDDPEAHFVLVGFSYGANVVRHLAHSAQKDGITIDLLVYLGGNTLENIPEDQPENALQIVNILASGWIWNGATFDRAENIHEPDVWHFGSPTHPQTLQTLARELGLIAARLPVPQSEETAAEEQGPSPRLLAPGGSAQRGEWDFLKPIPQLPMPPAEDKAPDAK